MENYLSPTAAMKAKQIEREQLEADVQKFLANGGQIQEIPRGKINGQAEPTRHRHNERTSQTNERRVQGDSNPEKRG